MKFITLVDDVEATVRIVDGISKRVELPWQSKWRIFDPLTRIYCAVTVMLKKKLSTLTEFLKEQQCIPGLIAS